MKETHLFLEPLILLMLKLVDSMLDFVFFTRLKLLNNFPGSLSFLLNGFNLSIDDTLNRLPFLLKILLLLLI